jgi:hypothetical protein
MLSESKALLPQFTRGLDLPLILIKPEQAQQPWKKLRRFSHLLT